MGSAFGAAGQRCLAGSVCVSVGDEERQDALREALVARGRGPRRRRRRAIPATDVCPLVSADARERVAEAIERGEARGRRAAARRPRRRRARPATLLGPTIVDGADPESRARARGAVRPAADPGRRARPRRARSSSSTARATATPARSSPLRAAPPARYRYGAEAGHARRQHRRRRRRSPGSRSPAGRTRSTATCTPTAPTPSTSTPARRSSPPLVTAMAFRHLRTCLSRRMRSAPRGRTPPPMLRRVAPVAPPYLSNARNVENTQRRSGRNHLLQRRGRGPARVGACARPDRPEPGGEPWRSATVRCRSGASPSDRILQQDRRHRPWRSKTAGYMTSEGSAARLRVPHAGRLVRAAVVASRRVGRWRR